MKLYRLILVGSLSDIGAGTSPLAMSLVDWTLCVSLPFLTV